MREKMYSYGVVDMEWSIFINKDMGEKLLRDGDQVCFNLSR